MKPTYYTPDPAVGLVLEREVLRVGLTIRRRLLPGQLQRVRAASPGGRSQAQVPDVLQDAGTFGAGGVDGGLVADDHDISLLCDGL